MEEKNKPLEKRFKVIDGGQKGVPETNQILSGKSHRAIKENEAFLRYIDDMKVKSEPDIIIYKNPKITKGS